MLDVDYQEVLSLVATIIKLALPVGAILGLGEWSVSFFLKCVFPKRFKGD